MKVATKGELVAKLFKEQQAVARLESALAERDKRIAELEAAGLALIEVLSEYEAQWGDDYLAEKWGLREEAAGPRAVFSPPNQQPKEET